MKLENLGDDLTILLSYLHSDLSFTLLESFYITSEKDCGDMAADTY